MERRQTALDFLSAFFEPLIGQENTNLYLLIWSTPSKASRFFPITADGLSVAATAAVHRSDTENVYFGVSALRGPPSQGRGVVSDTGALVGLWADVDFAGPTHRKPGLPPTQRDAEILLEIIGPAPTIVVHSGHGLQAYWLFREPWIFDTASDRAEAAEFARRWIATIQAVAATRDWLVDPVGDLTRVLRVPGTQNRKDTTDLKDVVILSFNGPRYDPQELREFMVEIKPAAVSVPMLVAPIQPPPISADPPPDKLAAALANDPRFAATWERKRTDFKDQSASSYDLALASFGARVGWTDAEIAALLVAWRRKHGEDVDKARRSDYLARTLGKAREGVPADIESITISKHRLIQIAKNRTDVGNAARLVLKHGDDIHYVPAWSSWLIWDGRRWQRDESLAVHGLAQAVALGIFGEAQNEPDEAEQKALKKWAAASQTRQRIEAMVALARPDRAITAERLDTDSWLLNIANGILDLKSGELHPHRREDLMTKLAPVTFDPAAACPRWLAFLDHIMNGNEELVNYLQRIIGMCLSADVSEQALFIFFGPGANGKSVLLDTLTAILGDYAGEAAPDMLIARQQDEHPTQIADLRGRRLIVAGETEQGGRLRIALLKRLTGNARLKARFMHQDYFEFSRTHKLILATNARPTVREGTHAVWRRLRLVPFDVVIPESKQDKKLTEKLKAEWPGILAWALRGCQIWQRDGLRTPEEVVDATQKYEDEEDVLAEFLENRILFAANAYATRTALWEAYRLWGQQRREKWSLGRTDFYASLRRRPGVVDTERQIEGRKVRVFTGLALNIQPSTSPLPMDDYQEGR